MIVTAERRYAMTRIAAGDYLLPSNDGTAIWRIYSYNEDGSASWIGPDGKSERTITRTYWAIAKYDRPFHNQGEWTEHDFLDWGNWLTWDTTLRTRAEAIEAALR